MKSPEELKAFMQKAFGDCVVTTDESRAGEPGVVTPAMMTEAIVKEVGLPALGIQVRAASGGLSVEIFETNARSN